MENGSINGLIISVLLSGRYSCPCGFINKRILYL